MRTLRVTGLSLVLITGACRDSSVQPLGANAQAEEANLIDASRRWSAIAEAGNDVDAVAAYWDTNAVLMQDGVPTIRGREAARQMVDQAFKMPGFKISWEPIEAHVSASGDLGYIIERSRVTEPDANGNPKTHEMRAVTVWAKDVNGKWRNAVDISNENVAPQ